MYSRTNEFQGKNFRELKIFSKLEFSQRWQKSRMFVPAKVFVLKELSICIMILMSHVLIGFQLM